MRRGITIGVLVVLCLALASCASAGHSAARPREPEARLHAVLADFDQCRALAMRALIKAQDLKCVSLYGRGWGLDMPEAVPEDMLIEGLWLFDYLYAMDNTSLSMFSYASAAEHPHLGEELDAFEGFLPEAAARTLDYHDKVSRALADAKARVNEAAAGKGAFTLQTIPATPIADAGLLAVAGDGFRLGWQLPILPRPESNYARYLKQHGYTNEWALKQAAEAGIEFIRPWDRNVFDWPDVEKAEGKYDWAQLDELLALLKKHKLGIWLPLRPNRTPPPDWLAKRLGDRAYLKGPDGKPLVIKSNTGDAAHFGVLDARAEKHLADLFDPEVSAAFCRFVGAVAARVKDSGVEVVAIELGDRHGVPYYGGPDAEARWRKWLQTKGLDPRQRWNAEADAAQAKLPLELKTVGVSDPAQRRMLLDVLRWREDELIAYYRPAVEAIRKVAPGMPITTQSCEWGERNESVDGRHNERLVRTLGLVPNHFSPGESIWDDLRRSYSGTHFSACGTHTGSGNSFSQYACSSYMHDSLCIYTMPTPFMRGFYWGDCFFYPDLRWRWSVMYGWHRFHERAQGMAPEMLNAPLAAQAAILWSDSSQKQQSFTLDWAGGTYGFWPMAANYNKVGCIGWDRILNSVGLAHDFVTEDQVRAGALARYRMLIMPAAQALPAEVCEGIRAYVQQGGIAIATSAPGLLDHEANEKRPGQLADVFGADFERFLGASIVSETPMSHPKWNEPLFDYWNGVDGRKQGLKSDSLKTLYCTFKPRDGAEVIERFTSDEPAVVLNSFGKGKAVAIGYPIGRNSFLSNIYHEHYGHNWADWPYGSAFQQGLFRWFELLWPRVGFEREAVVSEEVAPRAIGQDAGWPCWQFTRKGGGYRDYVWKNGKMPDTTARARYGDAAPRSVELAFRRAEGNPNLYLAVFNREGAYGHDPGAVHFEATSKTLKIELNRADVKHVYDLTLGCAVPLSVQKLPRGGKQVTALRTMIEPSMSRMLVVAMDDTVRLYKGNRTHGGPSEDELRAGVARLAKGDQAPQRIVIARDAVIDFLAERGPKGITVSCESPIYQDAAERLAAELKAAFGKDVRISRNSPRIQGSHSGLGVWRAEGNEFIEQPDILLGSHNESHCIAAQIISPGFHGHTQPLTVMPSHTFPGPGRSVIALLRPYKKRDAQGEEAMDKIFVEEPAHQKLLVGASDVRGPDDGVSQLIKLVRKAGKRAR